MELNIEIENKKTRYGFIRGKIGNYNWFALVQKEDVDYAINPNTLEKGKGKIVRLCIYKDILINDNIKKDGNITFRRLIYASYKRDWEVLSKEHNEIVKKLVDYLNRRYSLRLVK